jgi:hypothetical protein
VLVLVQTQELQLQVAVMMRVRVLELALATWQGQPQQGWEQTAQSEYFRPDGQKFELAPAPELHSVLEHHCRPPASSPPPHPPQSLL